MDINELLESEESNHSLHSLSCASSSTIFHNTGNNKITEKGFLNRFMTFCETNIFSNASQCDNDIAENATSEEDFIDQCINENMEKPVNEKEVPEKPSNEIYLTENPLDENNFSENAVNINDLIENSINENEFTEKVLNEDFIENTINENNFIKKLMTTENFIEKFLENTTEKNANGTKKANPIKNITYVNPKRPKKENIYNIGKENLKSNTKTNRTKAKNEDEENIEQKDDQDRFECTNTAEPVAYIKLEVLEKLKISTRTLIKLLEQIQFKTHSNQITNLTMENLDLADIIRAMPVDVAAVPLANDIAVNRELKKLQEHTKSLDAIHVEHVKDDCSVYKRLTRKCICMNQVDYNDFIIHFNEDSKFFTNNTGEIIKNVRILKKFLYIGGEYSKRAFTFLNEGLATSNHVEKIEIIQGCSHADICKIFEDYSIVITFISWPCKSEYYGDSMTQSLAATMLLKLAQVEEGRRYLNYTSKISTDIKKVLRKKSSYLSYNVKESLKSILNLLQPAMVEHISSVTYYCKAVEEGFGFKTVTALARYRQYLTLEEVFIHLDLIHKLSKTDCGKNELRTMLPVILSVFRNLLFEFDNSEMNIILTKILNNIISRNILSQNNTPTNACTSRPIAMAETTTDAIEMKNESNQIPIKKSKNKSWSNGFLMKTTKTREPSRRKIWELSPTPRPFSSSLRLKKNTKVCRDPVIVVPMDKKSCLFRI